MKWFIISQSFAMVAAGVSFPFYLLFIQNIGNSFSSFGFAYGLFTLSAALSHRFIGKVSDMIGGPVLLLMYSIGMSLMFLFIPSVDSVQGVYLVQLILGILGAIQKTSEKVVLSDLTEQASRGKSIGAYHFWTSIFSSVAVMGTGFLLDYFTIHVIFYGCSIFFMTSGILIFVFYSRFKSAPENSDSAA
ncbi:MFS transporter [Bacillus sp. BHET2]|uniref:MFS transporter n=1 Tax=Bacillus sp. BHET2 TaxID=2583818 RepID=UPI00110F128E|nr:MFS transporter [Bacillus sp. BHET2]TMU87667.1 MFS transporter [Bacillus sp. BHET2]